MLLPLLLLPHLLLAQQTGLAIVYGQGDLEFWSSAPEEQHCDLQDAYPYFRSPSLNSWENTLITCYNGWCTEITPTGYKFWRKTKHIRVGHSTAVTSEGLLLVGGRGRGPSSTITELLPWEGGESREVFTLQHERELHCSIQTSPGTIVLTGGYYGISLVTEYSGLGAGEEVTFRELPPLLQPRWNHACGWYSVGDSQVLLVTGGADNTAEPTTLDSTEVFSSTGTGAGSWRYVARLPSARTGLRAAKVGDILHVTGGWDSDFLDEILTWDSVSESWSVAGHMKRAYRGHQVTEVPLAVVANYCSANN